MKTNELSRTTENKYLYFAYGSNLNKEQMKYRCPKAIAIGGYYLNHYKLVFRSVADIEEEVDSICPIGIWEVTKDCLKQLDAYEGYPKLYRKKISSLYVNPDYEGEVVKHDDESLYGSLHDDFIKFYRNGNEPFHVLKNDKGYKKNLSFKHDMSEHNKKDYKDIYGHSSVKIMSYIMNDNFNYRKPNDWYLQSICEGYKNFKLPTKNLSEFSHYDTFSK